MTDGRMENETSSYALSWGWGIINSLEMYYSPILVAFGTIGNCLSVFVVCSNNSKMRRTSSSLYLAALALSDTGFLATVFVSWLSIVNVHIMHEQFFCQLFVYLSFVCSFFSAWFVVAFTVERFVAVCYPLRRAWVCTVNRAKMLISGVTLAGLVLFSPVLLYTRPRRRDNTIICSIADGWQRWATGVNYFDTFVTFALPFCLIVVLNSRIIRTVCQVDSVRTSLKAGPSLSRDSPPSTQHQQSRVTKMLLIVSSVFFCLNLPAYAMRVYAYLQPDASEGSLAVLIQKGCNLLFDTNFGISFGLYCASGQNFRSAVGQLFNCRHRQPLLLRIGQSNQLANPQGTETIRISGSVSGDHTFVCGRPWKDSFQLTKLYLHSSHEEMDIEEHFDQMCE